MIMHILVNVGDNMVPFMLTSFLFALVVRYFTYLSSSRNAVYYRRFCSAVEKLLESDYRDVKVEDTELWMNDFLAKVVHYLPERKFKMGRMIEQDVPDPNSFRGTKGKDNIFNYSDGRRSIIHGINRNMGVFVSQYAPDYSELTYRVLGQDPLWRQAYGLSFDKVSKAFDILPGLFVVAGILGTFIGIASALPKIGMIDLSKIQESSAVLTAFIDSVASSMKCSITGIFCSMSMTVLISVFPIYSSRAEVRRSLQKAFEHIWTSIHGSSVTSSDLKMIGLLQEVNKNLTRISQQLSESEVVEEDMVEKKIKLLKGA